MSDGICGPDERLLLWAVRTNDRGRAPATDSNAVERTFRLAVQNHVEGSLCELVGAGTAIADESVLARARALRGAIAVRNELARRQIRRLAQILADVGTPVLLYKGLDFEERFYPPGLPRTFTDIDLIVAGSIDAADRALRSAGYLPPRGAPPLAYYRRFHLHAVYHHAQHALPLELHWALDSPYAREQIDPGTFVRAGEPWEPGSTISRPAPIDALLLMALHLDKHVGLCATLPTASARLKSVLDFGGLVWVADVAHWFRSQSSGWNLDEIATRARSIGAQRALGVALRLACDLEGQSLTPTLEPLIGAQAPASTWLTRIVYPDLSQGRCTAIGRRIRRTLLRPLPLLDFRPLRVLEACLPAPRTGARRSGARRGVALVGLGLSNLAAVVHWKLKRLVFQAREP